MTILNTVTDLVRKEIEDVHDFIAAWFRGQLDNSAIRFENEFANRFAPEFINIQPAGRILRRKDLIAAIELGYGTNPRFEITISDVEIHHFTADSRTALATYLEHQRGAVNTTPPDNTRISTVLMTISSNGSRPTWLHLHETAYPNL